MVSSLLPSAPITTLPLLKTRARVGPATRWVPLLSVPLTDRPLLAMRAESGGRAGGKSRDCQRQYGKGIHKLAHGEFPSVVQCDIALR